MGCDSNKSLVEKSIPKTDNPKSLVEKSIPKTGNPKKDFFYCFDDEEIKLIEERKKKAQSSTEDIETVDLYSRFEIDYRKEKDENVILKHYMAIYVKKNYTGDMLLMIYNVSILQLAKLLIVK
jgi:hypothetical protein